MLFTKVAALALFSFAVATPTPKPAATKTVTVTTTATQTALSQCNVSKQTCCDSVQSASEPGVASLLTGGILGVVLSGVTGQVGVTCSPISVIGISGTSCTAQPVCCENNTFNGVVALGCTPININL